MKTPQRRPARGFTLLEMLVVIGIIAMLAAILFPAFNSARENGRQKNCASNLSQIYFAVQQYFQDERAYPDSIVDLLPEGTAIEVNPTPTPPPAPAPVPTPTIDGNAVGYLKSGKAVLLCENDDTSGLVPRSSYGPLTKYVPDPFDPATSDPSRYVWNYWGYDAEGFAYPAPPPLLSPAVTVPNTMTRKGDEVYDAEENPLNYSLSNRYADPSTIITHCVYHRIVTADGLNTPTELYDDATKSKNARDIVLRLDGSARLLDVTNWYNTNTALNLWQNQIN